MPLAVDFQGGVTSAWSNVITFVPKLAAALLIILAGYLIAKVVASVLNKVLERVGFDRAVERGGIRQALARSKYDPSDIIAKLAFWLIFLVTLQIAFGVFGPNPISDLLQGLIAYLPNVLVAIVIIVVAAAIAKAATDLLTNLLSSVSGGQVMAKGAGIAVLVFGAFAALDQLQIAPRIVTGLWYAILAIVVGSAVVAIGGGGIKTMQRYWERATTKAEERAPELTQQAQQSASTQLLTRGTGRRPTPTPGPRSSRPSGPAGHARPLAVQTAGRLGRTPGRGVPSANPSHKRRTPYAVRQGTDSLRCFASRARTTRLTRRLPDQVDTDQHADLLQRFGLDPKDCWAGSPAACPEASHLIHSFRKRRSSHKQRISQPRQRRPTPPGLPVTGRKLHATKHRDRPELAGPHDGRPGRRQAGHDRRHLPGRRDRPARVGPGHHRPVHHQGRLRAPRRRRGHRRRRPGALREGTDQRRPQHGGRRQPLPGRGGRAVPPLRPRLQRAPLRLRPARGTATGTATPSDDVTTRVGRDTSGPTTDDAMTRSEEELQVGTQTREAAGPGCAST